MSNVDNRKVTIKDMCDVTLNWINSSASNLQAGWSINNIAPASISITYGACRKGNAGANYTRVNENIFNAVASQTVTSQLSTYLKQLFGNSFEITDTTTILTAPELSDLESALSVFVFSKVKTYSFDGALYSQTARKVFLYDTTASVPVIAIANDKTNLIKANFLSHLVNNLNNNLQYNNNHKQIRYTEQYWSTSCCSSSSCSSSSSRFLAHIQ